MHLFSQRGLSRRDFLAASVATAMAGPHGGHAEAAEIAHDGFRLLRARTELPPRSGESAPLRWSFDGSIPGPMLRVRRGEEVKLRVLNELPEPLAVHWHGVRGPNGTDGVPHLTQAPIAPGASFDYRFAPPDAGTFWYRVAPSAVPQSTGMHGLLVVEEPERPDVDHDVAVVANDWILAALADGRPSPPERGEPHSPLAIPVRANERVRLRLLNATVARLLSIRMEGHAPTVMAIDGQPAEPFAAREGRVMFGPGNRVDLFVDATGQPGSVSPVLLENEQGSGPIARLVYEQAPPARARPRGEPRPLPPNSLPARIELGRALRLDLPLAPEAPRSSLRLLDGAKPVTAQNPGASIWTVGSDVSAGRLPPALFSVPRGRTVVLALGNRERAPSSVHLHGHHCRLLDALDDGWKPFWLDTVLAMPGQVTRVAFLADNPGKWAIDARPLRQDAPAMLAWFEVR